MSLDQLSCCGVYEMHVGNDNKITNPIKELRRQFVENYGSEFFMVDDDVVNYDASTGKHNKTIEHVGRRPPFIILTDRTNHAPIGLKKVVKAIKVLKLGTVWQSPAKRNDNSGYTIRMWVWQPNWKRVLWMMRNPVSLKTRKPTRKPVQRLNRAALGYPTIPTL